MAKQVHRASRVTLHCAQTLEALAHDGTAPLLLKPWLAQRELLWLPSNARNAVLVMEPCGYVNDSCRVAYHRSGSDQTKQRAPCCHPEMPGKRQRRCYLLLGFGRRDCAASPLWHHQLTFWTLAPDYLTHERPKVGFELTSARCNTLCELVKLCRERALAA